MTIRSATLGILFCLLLAVGTAPAQTPTQPQLENDARLRGDLWVTHVLFRGQPLPGVAKPGSKPGGGGGGGGRGGSCSAPQASFTGTAYTSAGAVNDAETTPNDAEEDIAAGPGTSAQLLAAISDFTRLVGSFFWNTTEYSFSNDNGSSWSAQYLPLTGSLLQTGDGNQWCANSDPVMAYDTSGNAYMVDLYLVASTGTCSSSSTSNGLYVSYLKGGTSLAATSAQTIAVVAPNLASNTSISEDKPWIAVDNSSAHPGRVYVSWTHFTSTSDFIEVAFSDDKGATWSTPVQVNPSSQNGAVQGSQIAVGSDGTVYVAYEVFFIRSQREQFLAVSTNGGASFKGAGSNTSPQAITPLFKELSFSSNYRKDSFSALAVHGSGSTANVYVAYPDQPSGCGAELEFVKSSDGGATFSSPVAINDNLAGEHFMPGIAVDSSGGIHVSWFDTRRSSSASSWDIFVTRSSDGGSTFSTNQRLNSAAFTSGSSSSAFIGDYSGNAAGVFNGAVNAHAAFTTGSDSNGGDLAVGTAH